MIKVFRDGRLFEVDSLRSAMGLGGIQCPVISAVGAGGKTSTIRKLAEEYALAGEKAIVLTTTHMREETTPWSCVIAREEWKKKDEILDKAKELLNQYGQVWLGTKADKGKMSSVPPGILKELEGWKLPLLIEADGARMLPLKVPGEREPVILPRTTHVLSVYGMNALGQQLRAVCFRSERAAEFLNKSETDLVTEADLVRLACQECGGRKGCPEQAEYIVVFHQADTKARQQSAERMARKLKKKGIQKILITSYLDEEKE